MLKMKIVNLLAAAAIAWGYGVVTYLVFFVITDRNMLISTILNAVAIIVIVLWERVESRWTKPKPETEAETKKPSASVKSGLYLFYIVVLIGTALLAAEPALPFLRNFADYFSSVQYGLLILVAVDTFTEQLFKVDMSKQ